jgi:hypothetical protein
MVSVEVAIFSSFQLPAASLKLVLLLITWIFDAPAASPAQPLLASDDPKGRSD